MQGNSIGCACIYGEESTFVTNKKRRIQSLDKIIMFDEETKKFILKYKMYSDENQWFISGL